jgi:zinc protease
VRSRPLLLALVLALLAPSLARAEARVTRDALPNGVRVVIREDPGAGVVAVSLLARGGSRFETPANAGITNFLQRAMLRGTTRRTGEQLVEAAERLGGTIDASGDVEYAEVRGAALARHWESLLALVAEVALRPALAPAELEKERRLVLGQIRTRGDNPFQLAFDTLLADLYGAHPYGLAPQGRTETVSGLGREALLAHHATVYRGERLVLAVSGGVDRERVLRAAGRLFGGVARGAAPAAGDPAPRPAAARHVLDRPAQQAQVFIGYLGPAVAEPEYAAVKVLTALLGGGMAGRLFVELRDREGLAYSVGALNPSRAGPSPVVAHLGTAPENVAAAEAGMRRELERVATDGVTAAELARAKAYVLGALAMDRRTQARHAWYLAFFEMLEAGWDFPERYARAVEAVTEADVLAAARRYLRQPTTVVLEPR